MISPAQVSSFWRNEGGTIYCGNIQIACLNDELADFFVNNHNSSIHWETLREDELANKYKINGGRMDNQDVEHAVKELNRVGWTFSYNYETSEYEDVNF